MHTIERTDKEVNDVIDKADKQENKGGSRWPGMTYEQGVKAAIMWIIGEYDDNPMEG